MADETGGSDPDEDPPTSDEESGTGPEEPSATDRASDGEPSDGDGTSDGDPSGEDDTAGESPSDGGTGTHGGESDSPPTAGDGAADGESDAESETPGAGSEFAAGSDAPGGQFPPGSRNFREGEGPPQNSTEAERDYLDEREREGPGEPFDVEHPEESPELNGEPADGGAVEAETEPEPGLLDATGPASDEEMPLALHVEEMVQRLAVVMIVAVGVSLLTFPFGEELIKFLWYSILPGNDVAAPHLYNPLELVITQIKVASLAGLVAALPVFVYETYLFMRPGLYPNERRYYLAAVPTSLVLAFVGITFAYFIVLPAVFTYFLQYSEGVSEIAFALGKTFNLILILMGYLAVVFQIPLFVMLAMMMGLVTYQWLAQRRLLFWAAFAGIAFLFSPDPTGMSQLIIAVTMIALFEGTLLLTKWTRRARNRNRAG